ncbi:MAG: S1-like domain-containing RNA-binding protein, partial [Cytophagales bacterium]
MIELGRYNRMQVIKHTTFGVYLSKDGDEAEILLPIKYVPIDT